jgi:hypothetical protein
MLAPGGRGCVADAHPRPMPAYDVIFGRPSTRSTSMAIDRCSRWLTAYTASMASGRVLTISRYPIIRARAYSRMTYHQDDAPVFRQVAAMAAAVS